MCQDRVTIFAKNVCDTFIPEILLSLNFNLKLEKQNTLIPENIKICIFRVNLTFKVTKLEVIEPSLLRSDIET